MLRQAPGGSRPVTSSCTHPLTKKNEKSIGQAIRMVLAPSPVSLSASTFIFSSAAGIEQDSTIDSPFVEAEPEMEVKPIMPCIICESKRKEDMTVNLRVGFKERQHKCLSKSIIVAPPLTKRS